MNPIRVVLAEDHTLVRAGIRILLETVLNVEVVAEVADGRDGLRAVREHQPDVILMDISMPGLNGLEATARVCREHPNVRVIILSMHAGEEYVRQALRAGAVGYLLKDASVAELGIALHAVMRGETYLSPLISKHVISGYIQGFAGEERRIERLTSRQREVLQLIAEGRTTQEIARILHISVKTVETHRSQLMDRLGIHDIAGLVRYAIRVGIVPPET